MAWGHQMRVVEAGRYDSSDLWMCSGKPERMKERSLSREAVKALASL